MSRTNTNAGGGGGGSGTVTSITGFDSIATNPGSITTDGTIALVNDTATPAASSFYGTNSSGVRGWFALPGGSVSQPTNQIVFGTGTGITSTAAWTSDGASFLNFTGTANNTQFLVDDSGQEISMSTNYLGSGRSFISVFASDASVGYLELGDVDGNNFGTIFRVDDPSQTFIFNKPNMVINGVPYQWTGTQGGVNTALINDSAGNLSWGAPAVTTDGVTITGDGTIGSPLAASASAPMLTFTQIAFGDSGNVMTSSPQLAYNGAYLTLQDTLTQNNAFINAGNSSATGTQNIGIGNSVGLGGTLFSLTTGSDNIVIGQSSGAGLNTGNANVIIGTGSVNTLDGSFENVIIGSNITSSSPFIGLSIALGSAANITASNQFVIGGTSSNAITQITVAGYPSTRDDSGTFTPVSFLYTDASGNILEAPLSAIPSSAALTATYVGYGSASNLLTGDSNFTRNDTTQETIIQRINGTATEGIYTNTALPVLSLLQGTTDGNSLDYVDSTNSRFASVASYLDPNSGTTGATILAGDANGQAGLNVDYDSTNQTWMTEMSTQDASGNPIAHVTVKNGPGNSGNPVIEGEYSPTSGSEKAGWYISDDGSGNPTSEIGWSSGTGPGNRVLVSMGGIDAITPTRFGVEDQSGNSYINVDSSSLGGIVSLGDVNSAHSTNFSGFLEIDNATQAYGVVNFYQQHGANSYFSINGSVSGGEFTYGIGDMQNAHFGAAIIIDDNGGGVAISTRDIQIGSPGSLVSYVWPNAQALAAGYVLTNNGAGVLTWAPPIVAFSSVTGTPTTLSGYGITDAQLEAISGDLTGQTSAVSSVATVTSPNDGNKHTYSLGAYLNIITVTLDVIQVQVTYTDENGTSQTEAFFPPGLTSANIGSIGNFPMSTMNIRVNPNTAITIKTTLTTGTGSIVYDVGGTIQLLN